MTPRQTICSSSIENEAEIMQGKSEPTQKRIKHESTTEIETTMENKFSSILGR